MTVYNSYSLSVAVCFLHAYVNDAHERRAGEIIREMAPDWLMSLSCEVLPEIKEYERISTTVINAYVQPAVDRYAREMERDMSGLGVDVPIMVMQSNGGMMPLSSARAFPIHIIESAPCRGYRRLPPGSPHGPQRRDDPRHGRHHR